MIEQIFLFSRLNKDTSSVSSESTDQNVKDEVEKSPQFNEEFISVNLKTVKMKLELLLLRKKQKMKKMLQVSMKIIQKKPHKKYVNIF